MCIFLEVDVVKKKNRGRPAKDGERYPSGKLKKAGVELMTPAEWARLRSLDTRLLKNPMLASEVGRLNVIGELSNTHVAVALKIGTIYGHFERIHGQRRSAVSPSYEMGFASARVYDNRSYEDCDWEERQIDAFRDLQKYLDARTTTSSNPYLDENGKRKTRVSEIYKIPRDTRQAIERLCVEGQPIGALQLDGVRTVLDDLAVIWRIGELDKQYRAKRSRIAEHRPSARPAAVETVAPKRHELELQAFLKTMAVLRPDLSEDDAKKTYATMQALKDRARFNATAKTLGGRRVPVG